MNENVSEKQPVCIAIDDDTIEVSINVPVRFKLPSTASNSKLIMVFLKLLVGRDEKFLCTFQDIATMFGYADRRNVHNFWQEFRNHGFDILAFLSRKVDLVAYIPLIEDFVGRNILLSVTEMHRKFMAEHSVKMSLVTFQKYLSQTCSLNLLRRAQKLLIQKTCGSGAVAILRLLS